MGDKRGDDHGSGTAFGVEGAGVRRDRAGAVLRHAAFRSGGRCGADRPQGFGAQLAGRHHRAGPPLGGAGSEIAGRRGGVPEVDGKRRRPAGGFSAGGDGAAGAGTRRGAEAQPQAGVRPHDRLGPDRPLRQGRRPRHELYRHHRGPARHRHRREAGAAAQSGGGFRRRRALSGVRPAGRGDPCPGHRPGPGDRLRHERWGRLADGHVLWLQGGRRLGREPPLQPAGRRRALL